MTATDPIVGIDLGTTLSAVSVFEDGQVRLLENSLGDVLTPSVVAQDERTGGGLVVGRIAKDILALHPERAVAAFKRDMGQERVYRIEKKEFSPVELSAYLLDSLRVDAERELGRPVSRCVVTVPAYFNDAQRYATKQAAEMAGFAVERVLNEPTAAAIFYGLHIGDEERTFLVFDLGGGTFDVCVMELFEGLLEVKAVAGESRLGGEDFTEQLARAVLEKAGVRERFDQLEDRAGVTSLLKRAELLKRQLSRWESAELTLPVLDKVVPEPREVKVTAQEAEAAYAPLLERLLGPCRSALRGAELQPADLDEVILVGGATRLPCVQKFVEDLFGRKPLMDEQPDRVVVRGAAVQAALCDEDAAVEDLVVTDVVSHSLGTEVSRTLAGQEVDGYYLPVIHRNTVIPTSRTERLGTVYAGQTAIDVRVLEGESRRAENNQEIGKLRVRGIPSGRPREVVDLTYSYDQNGILEVEAKVLDNGKSYARIFQRNQKQLKGAALERAKARIRSLKADPRERPRYRELIARAELLWSELPEDGRVFLGEVMANFEEALKVRTPRLMEEAYEQLQLVCQQLDGGVRW